MSLEELVEWLFANSSPILRHRIAVDLLDVSPRELAQLRQQALRTPEVQRWLANLDNARGVHGREDTHAENALAKLLEYGFDRSLPALDQGVRQVLSRPLGHWDPLVLFPFLLRLGYADLPLVAEWFTTRVEKLTQTAQWGSYDFYLSAEEAARAPKACRGKSVYRDEFGHQAGYALPTCYDFYALAYSPQVPGIADLAAKREAIVAFLSDPRFQTTVGGYGWDRQRRRCYAAGRVFLACVETRPVLFLEWGAGFASARQSAWFQQGLSMLESYRTPGGAYRFPPGLMAEKTGYYMYSGSHMGLGEKRSSPRGIELESTFRRLYIQKRCSTLFYGILGKPGKGGFRV
jgi:hypothetical protein